MLMSRQRNDVYKDIRLYRLVWCFMLVEQACLIVEVKVLLVVQLSNMEIIIFQIPYTLLIASCSLELSVISLHFFSRFTFLLGLA